MKVPAMRTPLLLASLVLVSCGSRGDLYTSELKPLPLLATSDALVAVVPQTRRAVIVPADAAAVTSVQISEGARSAHLVPPGELVAILAGTARRPVLDLLSPDERRVATLGLPGPFDAISFSPEGDLAVLTYSAAARLPGLAARNLNEIALLDLVSHQVTRMLLDTESLAPRQVVFAPRASARRLVAVALDRGVALFDARRPELPPRRISLRPPGSTTETTVLEALFSSTGRYLFVRASGVDDVVVVEIGEGAAGELTASVNFVAGGTGLSDIDAPASASLPHAVFAVYGGSKEAVLLDARGIADNAVRLPLNEALTQLRPLDGARALIFDGKLRSVVAWDAGQRRSGSAVLEAGFDSIFLAPSQARAVLTHPSVGAAAGGGAALSVISVEDAASRLRARVHPIQLAAPAGAGVLDAAEQHLFFAGKSDPTLVSLDLRSLEIRQFLLDAPAAGLLHLTRRDTVAALHGGRPDDVTLIPAGAFERPAAVRVRDFLFTADLDRPFEGE